MKTRFLTTILALFAIATAAQAQFGGGSGQSKNDPYIISTTDHLTELANNVNGGNHYRDTYFRLDADLDFTGKTYTVIGTSQTNDFCGNFNGNGHTISGVQLNRTASASSSSGIGLFGYFGDTTREAVIENLTLSNSTIKARLAVGGIVGLASGGTIRNCHVTSDVTIEVVHVFDHGVNQPVGNMGGIVGYESDFYTHITDCTCAATLIAPSGSDNIGGIVGTIGSIGVSIENCAYAGTINFGGTEYVGGIVGRIWDSNTATLTNNYTGGNCTLGAVGVAGSTQGTDEGYDITHIYTASINTGQVNEGSIVSVPIMIDGTMHYYAAGHTVVLADLCTSGTPADGMMWGYRAVIDNSNYVDVLPQGNGTWQFIMPAADVSVGIAGVKDITLTDGDYQYTTTVTLTPATVAYTGTAHKPTVAVRRYVTNLAEGTDFITDIPAEGYTMPGNYTIHIWGIGEYGGLRTATFSITKATESTESKSRIMEKLDRGTVAVKTTNGVYLSWRLLGSESLSNQAFDIYRDGIKIHTTGAHDATCYTDTEGTESSRYIVVPKRISIDGQKSVAPWTTNAAFDGNSFAYMDILFTAPEGGTTPSGENYTYSANDMSVADLDGDGEYEIIVKWDPSNSKDNSQSGYTGNVYIDAYKLDGTRMWRIDLGKNIRAGAHYTQFLVYDFDSDGKAEMMVKTSDGTQDGQGNYIGDKSKDYRNSGGTILSGPEFLTIFNGETGAAMQTVEYWPSRDIKGHNKNGWGDTYGNRCERYLAAVAYLDGQTPSAVFMRGYYTYAYAAAYTWDGTNITMHWCSENEPDGCRVWGTSYPGKTLFGQGAHSVSVADVDNDGYDEIIFGSAVLDNDGTVLMYDGRGHGDAEHVSDFDNDGRQEIFFVHESNFVHTVDVKRYNANTESGTEDIVVQSVAKDVGRGVMGNIDDGYAAASGDLSLFWAADNSNNVYNMAGTAVGSRPGSQNFLAYWDGDLGSELVAGTTVAKYSVASGTTAFSFDGSTEVLPGVSSNNGTKETPGLVADILGDWRDELIYRLADGSGMRIFFSTIPTEYRLTTLMHDSQYRCAVAWQNVGYNQPPHTSYYIGSAALAKNGSETLNYLDPQTPFTKVAYYDGSEIPTTIVFLDDDSEADTKNHELIQANLGEQVGEVNVTIEGRTLYKTGHWNTLCLPFSLDDFEDTPLKDADVRELVPDECAYANGTLTLKFAAVSAIEANKPYIVRWAASEENIDDPQFANVFLEDGINVVTPLEGGILFLGTYDTFAVPELELKHYLYMGGDSKLYYPLAPMNINAFRAYFILRDFVAGEPSATGSAKGIGEFVLNFGDSTTEIVNYQLSTVNSNDGWYSIDGRRLQGEPTAKGIYIHKGKKVKK